MCAGAIINARIKRLYVGACEPKTGACISKVNLLKDGLFNHNVEAYYGIGEEESQKLMKDFFQKLKAARFSATNTLILRAKQP
jgi:tRNA(adenine34) deaminase